jgi:predicted AlkP superfamily pyrophosphatase or phosphodiesterase
LSAPPRRISARLDVAVASWLLLALCPLLVLGPRRLALAEADPSTASTAANEPRLVLLLAIDQLRPDRLSPEQPGGLGRLQREGRVFARAALAHAFTETCPGHATMVTGRHPANIGLPGNRHVDPTTLELHYCVDDPADEARPLGAGPKAAGRSPRNLRVDSLGDWLKAQRPGSRVFSISAKDRAAITLGGRRPDAVYWLDFAGPPRFTTSGYYRASLPEWVEAWGSERVLAELPDVWHYEADSIAAAKASGRPDDHPAESPRFGRVAPHPLRRGPGDEGDDIAASHRLVGQRLYASPFLDSVTLAFARDLVAREQLGRGPDIDLLAVSLSATDIVGHHYGPWSWESRDALARLDRMVGEFLRFLESQVPATKLVVVLTADHGVLPLPEWLLEKGESACPLAGGRIDPDDLVAALTVRLDRRFGPDISQVDPARPWFARASTRLTLNRERVSAQGLSEREVLGFAEKFLEAQPGVAEVWSLKKVEARRGSSEMAALYANSWDFERAGDLAIQIARDCLLTGYEFGTSHGSPYAYDRAVPLIFFGPGVEPGRVDGAAATVDIAPTLARLLGIEAPSGLDGRALPLR